MASTFDSVNGTLNFSLDATISTNYWRRLLQTLRADFDALFPARSKVEFGTTSLQAIEVSRPLAQYRSFAEHLVSEARSRQIDPRVR